MNLNFRLLAFLSLGLLSVAPISLPAGVVITEFLAENDGGLHDSDGETPDWIEIFNDSAYDVNLAGWHLTDSVSDLSRWTFPATNLPAQAYLVVFASGKNRTVSGQELHTNFQLDNTGQYLALVRPDGTVAHSYGPAFPPQRRNVSFGTQRQVISFALLSSDAKARYFIPADDSLGTTWTAPAFDDHTWASGTNGLGYDRDNSNTNPGPAVLALDFDERGTTPVTQPCFDSFVINSNVSSTAIQTNPTLRTFGGITLSFSNTAPLGYDDRVRLTPTNSGNFTTSALLRDHIMSRELTGTGGLDLTFTGLQPDQGYVATVWSFDTGSTGKRISNWYANNLLVRSNYTFDGSVLPTSDADYQFSFLTRSTPSGVLVVSGRRATNSLANSPAVQINAVRLAETGYGAQIKSDVDAAMYTRSSSLYVRLPFVVTNLAALNRLVLKVRYDDGFIAYINGQQVASRNAPPSPSYSSTATATHPGTESENIPIELTPALLSVGDNVLAIHGLNSSASNLDFFIEAELEGQQVTDLPNLYLWPPAPGQIDSVGYLGFVADTKFSLNRGFYDSPVAVSISCATPGATIYWTTNGSAPSPANGSVFTSPIMVDHTLAIRAAAYAPTLIPTEVETHTYIFLQQVLHQPDSLTGYPTNWQGSYPADYAMDPNIVSHPVYGSTISNDLRSLPTLSIVMSHPDLWDKTIGIYPNSTSLGPSWERPASVELINPDGSTRFTVNCGVQIHGGASRDNARTPKHSFGLSFKSQYGPARLRHDWFDGPVRSFDTIVLRAMGFGDAWPTRYSDTSPVPGTSLIGLRYRPENATYLKDIWIKETFREMGHLATRSDFAHLYLNGLYWGLINPSERIDAAFAASHLGGRQMDWDVMAGDETYNYAELRDGSREDWDQLIAQVNAGIGTESAYQAVLDKIDVVNLIDYMMVHAVAEMEDWPFHNWYAMHRHETNGLPGTKWIFLPWDQEIGMDRYVRRDRVNVDSDNTPGRIYARLRTWPEFRRLYGDRVQTHLFSGGALTTTNSIARFEQLADRIHDALVPESARWGDARESTIGANPGTGQTFTRDEWWTPEIHELYSNYFGKLTDLYAQVFRTNGLYPLTSPPEFTQFGGAVPAGFVLAITHTNVGGSIYFTTDGSDPREYGTALVSAAAQTYSAPVPINAPTIVSARVLDGSGWSALVRAAFYPPQDLSKLTLTEIMYNPPDVGSTNGEEFEFLELKNLATNTLDLSGLYFSQGISFAFTNGTILEPGGFFVLVRNPAAFAARYPGVPIHGVYTGKLDNAGETIALSHPVGTTVFSFRWGNTAPWPAAANGFGFSLVPRAPGAFPASDDGTKWRASSSLGGSPFSDDPESTIPAIVINEILAHTDAPQLDAIELFNPTSADAAISGWFLTDDPANPHKFRIPDGTTIPGHGTLFFDATQFNAFPDTPTNFLLSSIGDQAYLFSAAPDGQLTGYSHGVEFGASFNGVSFGRYINEIGDEFYPPQIRVTLGQSNAGPRIGPVVINEVHYHPEPGGLQFIELLNLAPTNVPLFHLLFPTNTWRLGGLAYSFPTNLTLAPGELLLLTATIPAAFRLQYEVPTNVLILGPFEGVLQRDGEKLQLLAPDNPNTNAIPYVAVEELRYNDRAPWPAAADGSGLSLQRRNPAAFANSPANWLAALPTPGRLLSTADTDGDGLPDLWEIEFGTNPLVADADGDPDNDGFTNSQEYLAGTDPLSSQSALRLDVLASPPDSITLRFLAVSNRSYTILCRPVIAGVDWLRYADVPAEPTNRFVDLQQPPTNTASFFRLVTPILP